MRGKGDSADGENFESGITPAHAGKSPLCYTYFSRSWDHPRACGEKAPRKLIGVVSLGSPPRMRGKESATQTLYGITRITPAHAGKSPLCYTYFSRSWDHPRACGEKNGSQNPRRGPKGSPPRMRGKGSRVGRSRRGDGITPAHAGKSRPVIYRMARVKDHPRACGEKTKKIPYHRLFPLRSAPFSFSFA